NNHHADHHRDAGNQQEIAEASQHRVQPAGQNLILDFSELVQYLVHTRKVRGRTKRSASNKGFISTWPRAQSVGPEWLASAGHSELPALGSHPDLSFLGQDPAPFETPPWLARRSSDAGKPRPDWYEPTGRWG